MDKAILQQINHLSPPCHQGMSSVAGLMVAADESDLSKKQEKRLIASMVEKTNGDRVKVSAILGISPTTLWRKLKQHNISGQTEPVRRNKIAVTLPPAPARRPRRLTTLTGSYSRRASR